MVELQGIEPWSGDIFPGLLRAQSATDFLGPRACADSFADGLSHLGCPTDLSDPGQQLSSLDDASYRVESDPGLTDFRARSGGEGEVVARVIGNYRFADIVNEISLHPRPASPRSTTTVETDQPHVQLSRRSLTGASSAYPSNPAGCDGIPPSGQLSSSRWRMARWASRMSCCSRSVCRLSYSFLPRASAISTLARPSRKYSESGTMVWPFSWTF